MGLNHNEKENQMQPERINKIRAIAVARRESGNESDLLSRVAKRGGS